MEQEIEYCKDSMMGNVAYENINYSKELLSKVYLANVEQAQYHWHHEYEVVLVLKGVLQFLCSTGMNEIRAGEFIVLNSKQVHGVRGMTHNICLVVQFSPQIFETVLHPDKLFYFRMEEQIGIDNYEYLTNLMANIGLTSMKRDDLSKMMMRPLISLLATKILEFVPHETKYSMETSAENFSPTLSEDIHEYIKANFADPELKERLQSHFGMSEKTIYRYLKTNLGITIKDMIDTAKIEHACNLLREGCPIGNILSKCGFANEASFYRVFKKDLGITPKEYRDGKDSLYKKQMVQAYIDFNKIEGEYLLKSLAPNPITI